MIRKLQRKFIMITMGSLLIVMFILIGTINGINFYQTEKKLNATMELLTTNQGQFPKFDRGQQPKDERPPFGARMDEETPFQTRYFVVKVNSDKSFRQIDTGHIAAITSSQAQDYTTQVLDSQKQSGYVGIYKYSVVNQTDQTMVVFMDCRMQLMTAVTFIINSGIVALATLLLMFILVSVLSRKAIKPFIENAEKQKQFITDAGHEIKTPLAIISANTDVLEMSGGENEWIGSTRNQIARLDKLVKNLLTLTKLDEDSIKLSYTDFDLSETVAMISGPFAAIAETKNKKFNMNIQQGIRYNGDESSIEQLISTLVDNAMKYSDEKGNIRITLTALKKGVKLEVSNTVDRLDVENLDKLFDRFYRADSSRSRETGGYGIGLSIAKSIVEAHHGKISARSEDGKTICFTVFLSA